MITDEKLIEIAISGGWTVEKTSLYDDEGVEGWEWESPSGENFRVSGVWDDGPALDSDVRDAILATLDAQ